MNKKSFSELVVGDGFLIKGNFYTHGDFNYDGELHTEISAVIVETKTSKSGREIVGYDIGDFSPYADFNKSALPEDKCFEYADANSLVGLDGKFTIIDPSATPFQKR